MLSRLSFVPPNQSKGLDLPAWSRYFRRELRKAGITFGIGGIDVSFNEDHRAIPNEDRFDTHSCVHLWFVGLTSEISAAAKSWKKSKRFKATEANGRPVLVKPFDKVTPEKFLYALKPNFFRRLSISVSATKGRSEHRNTQRRDLRKKQAIELAHALDEAGIRNRMIILGTQIRAKRKISRSSWVI